MNMPIDEVALKIKEVMIQDGIKSILDVGCGTCHVTKYLYKNYTGEFYKDARKVGVDLTDEYPADIYETLDEVELLDMRDILKEFGENAFDIVLFIDSLEHIEKAEGVQLLEDCGFGKLAKKEIVVFIPEGDFEISKEEKDPLQQHKAGWSEKDFTELGYEVKRFRDFHGEGKNALLCWRILK